MKTKIKNAYYACFQFQKLLFGNAVGKSANFIFYGLPSEDCRELVRIMSELNKARFLDLDLSSMDSRDSLLLFESFLASGEQVSNIVTIRVSCKDDGFTIEGMLKRAAMLKKDIKIILFLQSGEFYLDSRSSFLLERFQTVDLATVLNKQAAEQSESIGSNRVKLVFDKCTKRQIRQFGYSNPMS